MDSAACSPNSDFIRQVGARLRTHWLVKTIGLSVGMTAFFIVYFQLLQHPIFPVTIMPVTMVDRFIGFRPEALPLYISLWIYVPLACALLKSRRELLSYGLAAAALSAIGLGIFLLWPTAVPNLGTNWASYPSFSFLKSVDASGNACPSLHVAFAVFTAVRLDRLLREMRSPYFYRAGNWLWCLGIVYSTVATGQHVAIDVLAGAPLGATVAALPFFKSAATDNSHSAKTTR